DVFYPRIVEAEQNNESLSKLIIKATFILGLIGIIPFMIIVLIGPWIFSIVFGSDWFIAGRYARWLGIFLFFEFINKPSIKALPVLSAQLFHLIITTIMTVVRIASLCIGFFIFNNDVISIALFSLSSAFIHLILILIVIYKSKKFEHKYLY